MKRLQAAILTIGAVIASSSASARVTPSEYADVEISVPAQAALPLAQTVTDPHGQPRSLRELVSRPTVLVFADYTCRILCGPIVAFVGSALEQSGLRPGEQFRLLVVGLNPKDGAQDAASMRARYLTAGSPLDRATTFVGADEATIKTLTAALGYRYRYDVDDDIYIHPAAAYVLQADGRVSRALTGIGISAPDLRLALIEASAGTIGTLQDRVRLLCSGFDPAHGTYDLLIGRLLALAAGASVLALAGLIAILLLAGRRRAA